MENIREVRNELLSLHRILMNLEKESYEAEYGIITPNQLLQMLIEDERFAWLRAISILVVEIDEMLANKSGIDSGLSEILLNKTRNLFDQSLEFNDFKEKYKAHLDIESIVSEHHWKLQKLLDN